MNKAATDRRNKLFSLVHGCFAGNTDVVAAVIEERTPGAKVSVRTIQAWLMAPGRASSRNCPPWALKALDDYIADPANRPRLEALAQIREASIGRETTPSEWFFKVHGQQSVEIATSQIEEDKIAERRWQDLLGKEPGRYIFELEKRHTVERAELSKNIAQLHQAIALSSSFEEFKRRYLELERASRHVQDAVKDTRKPIEDGSAEFGADDAVLWTSANGKSTGD